MPHGEILIIKCGVSGFWVLDQINPNTNRAHLPRLLMRWEETMQEKIKETN